MANFLSDWIESRTGYRGLVRDALDEPIPGGARWRYVFGSALTSTFFLQLFTGLLLMTAYSPSATTAWGSVYYISHEMSFGWIIRGLHHFGSQAMVILLVLHLIQVTWAGAFRAPREINWWLGLGLMLITLGFSLTGYLLPWDQKGYWATKVATNIMGGTPVLGEAIRKVVVGGNDYGNQTLTRFYGLHVGILPMLMILLLVAHIALFRRHGVTHPPKTQGRMSRFWPEQVFMDVVVSALVFGLLFFFVWRAGGANLDAPADPSSADYPARPEWYFLSLFQMLKLFPGKYEIVGTMIVPGAIFTTLLVLPLLDKVLPWRIVHFFACTFVFALVGGAGFLTYQATIEDLTNRKFQTDRARAEEAADRALFLAHEEGIPPEGAGYLLRRDPAYHGRHMLEQQCLSCHYFDGQGQFSHLEVTIDAERLAQVTETLAIDGLSAEASTLLAAGLPDLQVSEVQPVEEGGQVIAYAVRGENSQGEKIDVRLEPAQNRLEWNIRSKQTAADLHQYGTREWLRGMLEDPSDDRYFGQVPQLSGMARWKRNSKLSSEELDQIADFFEEHVITAPEDLPASEWEDLEEVYEHPGYDAFHKEGECASCHVVIDWSTANDEAPNLYGWGSPWYTKRLISRPGAPHFFGYLDEDDQMPPFGDKLTENDMDTIVRFLKGDFLGARPASEEAATQ